MAFSSQQATPRQKQSIRCRIRRRFPSRSASVPARQQQSRENEQGRLDDPLQPRHRHRRVAANSRQRDRRQLRFRPGVEIKFGRENQSREVARIHWNAQSSSRLYKEALQRVEQADVTRDFVRGVEKSSICWCRRDSLRRTIQDENAIGFATVIVAAATEQKGILRLERILNHSGT